MVMKNDDKYDDNPVHYFEIKVITRKTAEYPKRFAKTCWLTLRKAMHGIVFGILCDFLVYQFYCIASNFIKVFFAFPLSKDSRDNSLQSSNDFSG